MLKADLHLHTSEDITHPEIRYSAKELIEFAAKLGFNVISITNHYRVTYSNSLRKFAEKKGILLIPGAELRIKGKDVLAYNISKNDAKKVRTFEDLKKLKKKKNILVIAPHPFYVFSSLGKELAKNIGIFDAIEYSHFYLKGLNIMNRKAARFAHMHKKPLVGTSDAHHLWRMNFTYTLIDSDKNINSIINSIKKNKIRLVSRPLSLIAYLKVILWALGGIKRFINK